MTWSNIARDSPRRSARGARLRARDYKNAGGSHLAMGPSLVIRVHTQLMHLGRQYSGNIDNASN